MNDQENFDNQGMPRGRGAGAQPGQAAPDMNNGAATPGNNIPPWQRPPYPGPPPYAPPQYGYQGPPPYGDYPPYGYQGQTPDYGQGAGQSPYPPGAPAAPQPQPAQQMGDNAFSQLMNQLGEATGLGNLGQMLSWDDKEFWKGALVGAAVVMFLTNDSVRSSLKDGFDKVTSGFSSEGEPDASQEKNEAAEVAAETAQEQEK